MKKYKLTRKKVIANFNGKEITLYRIQALTDIYDTKGNLIAEKGQLGGFVENEENLSQFDGCWIADNSKVFGGAKVRDDSLIQNSAIVCQNSLIKNNAVISGNAKIKNSEIACYASVSGCAKIEDESKVSDRACISGEAVVKKCEIKNRVNIMGKLHIENTIIRDNVTISGENSKIENSAIDGGAKIDGEFNIIRSFISGHVTIDGKTLLKNTELYSNVHVGGSELVGIDILPVVICENAEVVDSTIKGAYMIKNNAKIAGEQLINSGEHTQVIMFTDSSYLDLE